MRSYDEIVAPIDKAIEERARARDEAQIVSRCLADVPIQRINWLWQPRIARGKLTMIAGNPGLGKSQITANLAATVTTGGTWPVDGGRCEAGSVVFLSAEDDAADTIKPRLMAAGADASRIHVIDAVRDVEGQRAFNLGADLEALRATVQAIGDVRLIVIDPITAYLGQVDSHRNAEVRAALAPLGELAAALDVAVVAVSHLNKGGSADALMRVTGSLAFVAAARAAWIVAKDPDDDDRRLFLPAKNNIGADSDGLAFSVVGVTIDGGSAGEIETSRVEWEPEAVAVNMADVMAPGDSEERSATDDAADFLADTLRTGPVAAKEVQRQAKQAGLSDKALRRAKSRLNVKSQKQGFSGEWVWALPEHQTMPDHEDAPKMPKAPQYTEGASWTPSGHLGDEGAPKMPKAPPSGDRAPSTPSGHLGGPDVEVDL